MIAFLKGILVSKSDGACVVDVNGVGYEVNLPLSDWERLPSPGEPVTLYTWYLGREDGVQLYGFSTPEGRQLFKLLLGVSGIGPKSALAILAGLSKSDLEQAVARQDVQALTRLPGIGRKTAERLLLELKDKLKGALPAHTARGSAASGDYALALEALLALGYPVSQARQALQKVADLGPASRPGQDHVADIVKEALRQL